MATEGGAYEELGAEDSRRMPNWVRSSGREMVKEAVEVVLLGIQEILEVVVLE